MNLKRYFTRNEIIFGWVIMIVLFGMIILPFVEAETMHVANQVTFAWDASPVPECTCPSPPCSTSQQCPGPGWPSPAAGAMYYQAYVRQDATSPGVKVGKAIQATEIPVIFPAWGKYYLGVEAIFWMAGETEPIKSTRSWSNVDSDTASGLAFGVGYLPQVAGPKGLRIK